MTPCEAPSSNEEPAIGKAEAASTSAWESVLNAAEQKDERRNFQSVEEQPVETGTALGVTHDSFATVLQEELADEVKLRVKNTLAAIPDMVGEVVDRFFCAAALTAQCQFVEGCTMPWIMSSLTSLRPPCLAGQLTRKLKSNSKMATPSKPLAKRRSAKMSSLLRSLVRPIENHGRNCRSVQG